MEAWQPSLPRSRVSVKFFVKLYFRLYEKRASPPWRDLAIDYPRSRLGGLEIFHINALKRAWPAFLWITFHFTSSVCLCVGYEMKTCTQISDSAGFVGK